METDPDSGAFSLTLFLTPIPLSLSFSPPALGAGTLGAQILPPIPAHTAFFFLPYCKNGNQ